MIDSAFKWKTHNPVKFDEDGNAIDSQAKASNLKDDSGAVVQTFWSDDLRIETKAVDIIIILF